MAAIGPDVAPLWRRICAGLIDAGAWILIVGPLQYLAFGDREAPHGFARLRSAYTDDERFTRWLWRIEFAQRALRAGAHNVRTPGERLLGIRWADAATGERVSLSRGVAHELLRGGLKVMVRAASRSRIERLKAHHASVLRQTQQLRVTLAGDPEALQREIAALQRTNDISCWSGVWQGCGLGLVEPVSALRSPRRQSLTERIAGVVVVRVRY